MKHYSFVEESAVDNILAVGGMTSLGASVGDMVGKHTGSTVSKFNTRNLSADDISWTNPIFAAIVKKSLLDAKNKIKLANEWYNSCDNEDKSRARMDYIDAVNELKSIQKDIADRRADRWLDEYKQTLAVSNSEKFAKAGRVIGGSAAFAGTVAKLMKGK